MNTHYRQGDVMLLKIETLPPEAVSDQSEEHRIVLAYGEVTGHAHAVSTAHAAIYKHNEERYLVTEPGAQLVHEEHNTIVLEPGVYRVIRQREYSPREVRFVAD